jgi:cation diffusion facilitator CzcD-associated flavoprotein CzcO
LLHLDLFAAGGLSKPSFPDIPGLSTYEGTTFHSAAWDHSFDLTNKRVAVIGTGASAIQIIPAIQPKVRRLFVFQRTPAWVVPRMVKHYSKEEQQKWWWRWWMAFVRLLLFLFNELVLGRAMISNDTKNLSKVRTTLISTRDAA